jgi:hypothetical protein
MLRASHQATLSRLSQVAVFLDKSRLSEESAGLPALIAG